MVNSQSMLNPPVPTNTAIADTLAILNAISDAPGQAQFLAAVVDRAKSEAQAVLDSAHAVMAAAANSQAEVDRQRADVEAQRVAQDKAHESRRAALEEQHAAAMAATAKNFDEAAELIALAKASKARYDKLTSDLLERVASAAG